jgi:RimJ/RimL family protein N-acetyltransferase
VVVVTDHPAAPTLTLRPLQPRDCEVLLTWIDSADAMYQWSGNRAFTWPLDLGQLLRDLAAAGEADLMFAAVNAEGELVGHVRVDVNHRHRIGHIGRVAIAPGQRGRRLGVALMRELSRHAFDDLDLHRLQLGVYTFNTAALAAYRSAGFVVEGCARASALGSDGYWDLVTMALLQEDYRAPPRYGEGIRIAGPRDAESIAALLTQLDYPQDRDRVAEQLQAWAASVEGMVLVADAGKGAIGVVAVQRVLSFERPGACARLVALSVDADHRRTGAGRRLVAAAEAWGAAHGCVAVEVTSRRSRDAAQRFYPALGYEDRCGASARFVKALAAEG